MAMVLESMVAIAAPSVPFYERNDFSLLKSKDEDLVTRLLFFDLASIK